MNPKKKLNHNSVKKQLLLPNPQLLLNQLLLLPKKLQSQLLILMILMNLKKLLYLLHKKVLLNQPQLLPLPKRLLNLLPQTLIPMNRVNLLQLLKKLPQLLPKRPLLPQLNKILNKSKNRKNRKKKKKNKLNPILRRLPLLPPLLQLPPVVLKKTQDLMKLLLKDSHSLLMKTTSVIISKNNAVKSTLLIYSRVTEDPKVLHLLDLLVLLAFLKLLLCPDLNTWEEKFLLKKLNPENKDQLEELEDSVLPPPEPPYPSLMTQPPFSLEISVSELPMIPLDPFSKDVELS